MLDVRLTEGLGIGGVGQRHKAVMLAANNKRNAFVLKAAKDDRTAGNSDWADNQRLQAVAGRPVKNVADNEEQSNRCSEEQRASPISRWPPDRTPHENRVHLHSWSPNV